PLETIASVTNTPPLAATRNHAQRDRQQRNQTASGVVVAAKKTAAGLRELFSPPAPEDELPEPMGRQALEKHLNRIRAEADRIFGTTPERPEPPQQTASEDVPEPVVDSLLLTPEQG